MTRAHDPGEPTRDPDEKFRSRAAEIAAFRQTHGRFPAGRAVDPHERVLGRWLSNVRTTHRGNVGKGPSLNPKRIEILNELIAGWSDVTPGNVADDEAFTQRVLAAAAYRKEHGRLPTATDPSLDRLGGWLTRVRAAARGRSNMAWSPAREAIVKEHLPGWLEGDAR